MHIETHPFPPVLPEHATVMMSGSFPPTADKRSMAFHYPNYQNDMWRVYGAIFYDDPKHFEVAGEKRFDANCATSSPPAAKRPTSCSASPAMPKPN